MKNMILLDAGPSFSLLAAGITVFIIVIIIVLIFIAIKLINRAQKENIEKTNDLKNDDHGKQNK
jgi:large-conductance mechanosensitive channel